jgi:prevent-host-death family protein
MTTLTSEEAHAQWEQLLDRVAQGEEITISRDGIPVGVLSPAAAQRKREIEAAIARIKEMRKGRTLGGVTPQELIDEAKHH